MNSFTRRDWKLPSSFRAWGAHICGRRGSGQRWGESGQREGGALRLRDAVCLLFQMLRMLLMRVLRMLWMLLMHMDRGMPCLAPPNPLVLLPIHLQANCWDWVAMIVLLLLLMPWLLQLMLMSMMLVWLILMLIPLQRIATQHVGLDMQLLRVVLRNQLLVGRRCGVLISGMMQLLLWMLMLELRPELKRRIMLESITGF